MENISVNTQSELDVIDVDFNGHIYILGKNITVKKKYLYRVEAWENSSVVAWENSSVVAWENSSVEAWENSSVEARGNSSVVARGNSSLKLKGFSQASIFSKNSKVSVDQMGRFIYPNSDFETFAMYHGIKVNNGIATLYKSVRKNLSSFRDSKFKYAVGEFLHHEVDEDVTAECSIGLHVSHLDWAIRFGKYECDKDGFVILECEVPVDKIILPESSDGKVRTSDLFVVREVPENEWKNLK